VLGEELSEFGSENVRLEPMNHVSDARNLDETMVLDLGDPLLLLGAEAPFPRDDEGRYRNRF
jgi:hypothetical protein